MRVRRDETPGKEVAAVPQAPGPVSASGGPVDGLTIGAIWWSYQPSESSYVMTTAVLLQSVDCFQEVDRVHDECLLVQRIGVAGVAVLISRCLQEADGRQIAGA